MQRKIKTMVLALIVGMFASTTLTAAPQNKSRCVSLQARCALQVGGTCDPVTGRWRVPAHLVAVKNACLSEGLRKSAR
jgi:hypothetical protein